MMKNRLITFVCALCLFGFVQTLSAQKTDMSKPENELFSRALENYDNRNYSLSFEQFQRYIHEHGNERDVVLEDACYYRAASAYMMMNRDADRLIKDFIEMYPASSRNNDAKFLLANYYVQNRQYDKASEIYTTVRVESLSQDRKYEYYYKSGHCFFEQGDYASAKTALNKVKDAKSKYAAAATYFYGHILYDEGKYNLALKEFLSLREDRNFGRIVPYYIAQIYYYQQKYEELIGIAAELSQKSQSKRSGELNRMLGDSYYKLGRYHEAVPYLEKAVKETQVASAQDYYLLGYTLFEEKQYDKAAEYLKKASMQKDSLSQNALYHLGICYIQTEDLQAAKAMFKEAYDLDFDRQISEKSLINYAKLSYQTNAAYNESIKAFQTYIEEFPQSSGSNEARRCLAQLYGNTQNYRDAIEMIEQMDQRTTQINKAYQKLCLNRAIECFNESKMNDAVIYLDKSLTQAHSNELTSAAYYLKAEAYYQMGEYELSVQNLNTFYSVPDADKSPYASQADYAMGYNLFKQKKYSLARDYFKRCIAREDVDDNMRIDATTRYADCLYMCKDFNAAIVEYDKVIRADKMDVDYASYQKAMACGALGNYTQKSAILGEAISKYKNSSYMASMRYELANAYLTLEMNQQAIDTYQSVIDNNPSSIHVKDCYGKIGMIYYKLGDDKKALVYLDKLVRNYPGTEEAKAGLMNIKSIYIDANDVESFFAYTKELPDGHISQGEQDSISYQAAENRYMNGDCPNAIIGFRQYLNNYPNGAFYVNANYYMADCLEKVSQKTQALESYENITGRPKNIFTEKALLKAADLNFEMKNVEQAKRQYYELEQIAETSVNKLHALKGSMQCYYALSQFDSAIIAANKLLSLDKLDEGTSEDANYVLAKSLLANENTGQAVKEFEKLTKAKNTEYASEAQYVLAEINYKSGNMEQAEKIIHQINANPSSEYWLAKTFILWADIFNAKGNTLQAKQTLQSIIDNYDGEELIAIAKDKLDELNRQSDMTKKAEEEKLKESKEAVDEVIISGE